MEKRKLNIKRKRNDNRKDRNLAVLPPLTHHHLPWWVLWGGGVEVLFRKQLTDAGRVRYTCHHQVSISSTTMCTYVIARTSLLKYPNLSTAITNQATPLHASRADSVSLGPRPRSSASDLRPQINVSLFFQCFSKKPILILIIGIYQYEFQVDDIRFV